MVDPQKERSATVAPCFVRVSRPWVAFHSSLAALIPSTSRDANSGFGPKEPWREAGQTNSIIPTRELQNPFSSPPSLIDFQPRRKSRRLEEIFRLLNRSFFFFYTELDVLFRDRDWKTSTRKLINLSKIKLQLKRAT